MNERIKKVFEIALNLEQEELNNLSENSSIFTVPGWDSLGHLKLVTALEKEFSISITNLEAIELIDISQIKKILKSKNIPS